ncbi:CidA/LrgA family protein [Pantoea sp. RRHST58]|uniref:CidA/LrgA family protein n=1 Tax=Pantoea sp. RRHST58 TaxID=3425183 RepID=UPI0028821CF0|nr:CidA/LrgA family protein [Enterobacter sp. BRE11]
MPTVLSLCWRYVRAFVIIYLCLYAGNALSLLLPVTIPGSILGMLTLFALLATQILPVEWVKPGCHLLIRYMALLFVPISVGVMNYTDVLSAQFGPVVVSIVVSTFLVLTIVGWSAHKIHTRSVQEKPSE